MGLSETEDSGMVSGGRSSSNFKQTCILLSQYLKEKRSFGDLNLGLSSHNPESKGTLNLLPMIERPASANPLTMFPPQAAAGRDETHKKSEISRHVETAQMTIFYAGQVIVFNDFPADKAAEIMMLAGKSTADQNHAAGAPLLTARSPAESAPTTPEIAPVFALQDLVHHSARPAPSSDLPIARKNSLARFLEKRKDRVTANAPYQASKPAAQGLPKPPPKTEAWLGLAPLSPLHTDRH